MIKTSAALALGCLALAGHSGGGALATADDSVVADSHSRPLDAIPNTAPKTFGRIHASHFAPTNTDERIGRYGAAFARRFTYGDTRSASFLGEPELNTGNDWYRFDTFLRSGAF